MQRTPLPTVMITQTGGSSESDIAVAGDTGSETSASTSRRPKRKIDRGLGMNELFTAFKEELAEIFENKFSKLHTELLQLKKQNLEISKTNTEMSKSMEFMSSKYDEMKAKFDQVLKERDDSKLYICSLEEKIENLEKNVRASTVEIKNIPKKQGETKANLVKVTSSIGSALKLDIQASEIQDIYRIPLKKEGISPILVKFSSVLRKEEFLESVKRFNKGNNGKLNTHHIGLNLPSAPIYVTEHLTAKTSKLFFQSRDFARTHDYQFCWCSRGKIFLRKREGDRFIVVINEKQLNDLKTKV